jgi:hypothetical protein
MITVNIDQMKMLVNWKAAVLETRCIKKGEQFAQTRTFRLDDYTSEIMRWHEMTREVSTWNHRGYSCYTPINTIRSDFTGNEANGAKDSDIVCLNWFFIDADRKGTHKNSATDSDLEMSRELVENVRAYLLNCGWDDPIMTCSGNGYHLYFPLHELPANDKTKDWIKKLTNILGTKFNTEHVAIDPVVYNPSRITKILGTIAHKGEATEDRPHREARLVSWN